MSLATLPGVPVTISRYTAGTDDTHGVPTATWVDQTPVHGQLQQQTSSEVTTGEQTTVADWLLILPAGNDIVARDRFTANGALFEVVGEPWHVQGRRGEHHVQVKARSVNG